jgi:hypothetical protein
MQTSNYLDVVRSKALHKGATLNRLNIIIAKIKTTRRVILILAHASGRITKL